MEITMCGALNRYPDRYPSTGYPVSVRRHSRWALHLGSRYTACPCHLTLKWVKSNHQRSVLP